MEWTLSGIWNDRHYILKSKESRRGGRLLFFAVIAVAKVKSAQGERSRSSLEPAGDRFRGIDINFVAREDESSKFKLTRAFKSGGWNGYSSFWRRIEREFTQSKLTRSSLKGTFSSGEIFCAGNILRGDDLSIHGEISRRRSLERFLLSLFLFVFFDFAILLFDAVLDP